MVERPATLTVPPGERLPDTPRGAIDARLGRLRESAGRWPRVGTRERRDFLRACRGGVGAVSEEWVRRSCMAQGIDPTSQLAGEAWLSGPVVTLRTLRLLERAVAAGGRPRPPRLRRQGEQWIADVVPAGLLERTVYAGIRAEVRIEPGRAPDQGAIYRRGPDERVGGVAAVLGGGNVASIAPRDLLHQLFVEDRVVLLKMHPVNRYLGPLFEAAFASLIEAGYLEIVYGGAEIGAHVTGHPGVDAVHLTGSDRTYDAIVWGADSAERDHRKKAGAPLLRIPVTAELGCVTPVIVVPGRWRASDLDYQARSVAGMIANNASFNCNAAKLLVLAADWPQRGAFLQRLAAVLTSTPTRSAYYPGAAERHRRFCAAYPGARELGSAGAGHLPWTLVEDVPPRAGEPAFGEEAFCSVVATTALPAADAEAFLQAAVEFCNREVWGSLSAMLIVDPTTERELGPAMELAVDALRYGGVAVNAWSGLLFGLAATSWGAWPGNDASAVESGIGAVGGNTYLFDHPQKSVARMPFRSPIKPLWFPEHRRLASVARALAALESAPAWRRVPRVAVAALRG